ncbi:conserved hypothetical protein [Leishmania infantum JPCM5]|uniref:Uncharacterized protein n=2 Tax=Leishmania infantum TaxID=5671 RepID=A4HRX1_LEIIN|nr:conserved hypothetical protein [Leishmania infantum JPCM5]CAC9439856.1 hypothetical_protein_-_conserved [Leishmania infantum]CAM60034.1 conserved hypothetical protein [Leishmania infantum JPCM5]SUZ38781.1 hypothetical_protein_-_conserved [Leishmania infantum]|eukprot:XP_001462813.1 conserved hypothetical protein [Leishmania infantum JPCM5]
MNLPPSSKAPDADSPRSFRAESEAATACKPLHLRSPPPPASRSPSAVISASASLPPPLPLHRSSSLVNHPALSGARRLMDDSLPPPPPDAAHGIAELVAPHELQLYNTEVRSCGHPQRLYVKVPVSPSGSMATERGHQDRVAPVPCTEGTETATPRHHPASSLAHAFSPPLAPVGSSSAAAADATPPVRGTECRAPPLPLASPAVLVSPYAAESARASVGSEPLQLVVTDGVRTPASSASASLTPAATAETSAMKRHHEDDDDMRDPYQPQPQQHQGRDGSKIGLQPSPPLVELRQLAMGASTFIPTTLSTLSSSRQRSVSGNTEERAFIVVVPADDATHSVPMPAAPVSGDERKLLVQLTEGTTHRGASAHISPAEVHQPQEGVSSAVMPSWAGHEAAEAAEEEAMLSVHLFTTAVREEVSASSTRSVSHVRSSMERSGIDFSSATATTLPSARAECWVETEPAVPAPWQFAEHAAYTTPHSQSGPIRGSYLSSASAAPASAAPFSTGREQLVGAHLDDEAGGNGNGDNREGSSDVRSLSGSEAEAWLLDVPGQPSATAEAEQQAQLYVLQPTGAETSEVPPSSVGSDEDRPAIVPVDASRSSVARSLPRELSAVQHRDDDVNDATATAAVAELVQQQQQHARREDIAVADTCITARDGIDEVVEGSREDGVGHIAMVLTASPAVVTADARAASSPTSFSPSSRPRVRVEKGAAERTVTAAAAAHSPVEMLEDEVGKAPSALAAPESPAARGGRADDDDVDSVMPRTGALEDVVAAAAADVVANATRARQPIDESEDFSAANDFENAPQNQLADAATDGEEVVVEGVREKQHRTPIPRAAGGTVPATCVVARSSPSDHVLVSPPTQCTVLPAVPAAMIDGGYGAHAALRARDAPPSAAHTTSMWRWPPQPSPCDRIQRGHRHHLSGGEQQQSWSVASPFQRRPVARDLLADVDVMNDEEDSAWEKCRAGQPRGPVRFEGRDGQLVPQHASSSAAAPPPSPPAADVVETLVLAHRRLIADAPLHELMELEREGRRTVMLDMLQDREAVLQEKAFDFSMLSLLPAHPSAVAAAAATGSRTGTGTGASSSVASDGAAAPRRAWVPPLPPPPTSREEVERLLRMRGLSGSLSLGIVGAALFTDELLRREVVEGAEASARTILLRLCRCGADALNPYGVVAQEALARQRLMATERLEGQQVRSLENSPAAGVLEMLIIGRELALCRTMEDNERRELIEKAEQLGRQRLRELHLRGLAARLRQRELLQASMNVTLRDAIDDVLFDEVQAREELRVEAIREMTVLLESASGTVVLDAARQHQRQLQQQREDATPQSLHEKVRLSATSVKSGSSAAAGHECARPAAALEIDAPAGEDVDDGSDWELVEEVNDLSVGSDVVVFDAAEKPMRSATAAATTGAATANGFATLVADGAPDFFEWDPTSNSASSLSMRSKAGKRHPSSSQQQPPHPQQQHTSTSSPSPHVTNMTALTVTTTANTASAITTTTASSGQAAVGDSGGSAPQVKQQGVATNASGNTTSDGRRSPTTVLPSEEEQQLVQERERVNPAEVSVLLHALRCAEAAVREKHKASRQTEVTVEKGSAAPAWPQDQDNSAAVSAGNLDGGAAQSSNTLSRPSLSRQQYKVISVGDVVDASHQPRATSHSLHASTTRGPPFINRHTIPCSLTDSPRRGYAALMRKYTPQRESQSSSPLPVATAVSASSPSTSSSSSSRPYADGDVYAYDPQRTRHSRPARRAAFETHPDRRAPWEHSREDISGEEAALGLCNGSGTGAPASVYKPTLQTSAREVSPAQRRRALSALEPSHVPSASTAPLVLEVITEMRSTRTSPAADVTVSPMSSGARLSQSPTRARPPQAYAAPTAVWTKYVQEQQLVRCVRGSGAAAVDGGGQRALHTSSATPIRNGSAATHVNRDQSSCSRRRWGHAEDHTVQHVSAPQAPLLITRLPLECGPGVWMSSPRYAHGGVHVVVTTTPPRTRPAPATLADAFSQADRTGGVVHLPTTVAELLRAPQHTHLPCPAPAASARPMKGSSRQLAEDRHARRQHLIPYNYVDVFYKYRDRSPRGCAPAVPSSADALVQPPSTPSAAFISARCTAVREREIQHELRQLWRAPSPSQARRAPPSPTARVGRGGSSTRVASLRRGSSTSSGSALIATTAATWGEDEVLTDASAESEGCYFDDDDAFALRTAAAVSRAGRHRAMARRRQQQQQPCHGALRTPAWSPASPPDPPPRQQCHQSASEAASGHHGGDGGRVLPAGYRVPPVPTPCSHLLSRTPPSLSSPASPSTAVVPSVVASSWRNTPAPPAPASLWGPSRHGMLHSGRSSGGGNATRSSGDHIPRQDRRVPSSAAAPTRVVSIA